MADIRAIQTTTVFAMGRLVANPAPPAGLTAGHRYWPLALAYDATGSTVLVLTANDAGVLTAYPIATFTWAIDNLPA